MRKLLKWAGIVLGGLLALAVVVLAGMSISTQLRMNRTYDIQAEAVVIPTDAASIAVGKHWADIHCTNCHTADLGGGSFFEEAALGYVDAPNLTSGAGGVGATNTDADWVRAIRHGVKADGKSVFIMPSNDFYYLSDADLGSIIAYVKTAPPVDRQIRPRTFTVMAKVLIAAGAFGNLLYAEDIQHDVRPPAPAVGVTAEYGEYMVKTHGCGACHGENLTGGKSGDPAAIPAPDITRSGRLPAYTEESFINTLRSGVRPEGAPLDPEQMPWQFMGKMLDDELKAIWLYLNSLPGAQQ
jgi:mono/diheme cytochrome c family protein